MRVLADGDEPRTIGDEEIAPDREACRQRLERRALRECEACRNAKTIRKPTEVSASGEAEVARVEVPVRHPSACHVVFGAHRSHSTSPLSAKGHPNARRTKE